MNSPPILTPIVSSCNVVDLHSPLSRNENEVLPPAIVQLNCHNSRATTYSILNSEPVSVFLLLLQEPWVNPLTCRPPDHEGWWSFYSHEHTPKDLADKHRVVTYIRKSVESKNIRVLPDNSKYLIAVEMDLLTGQQLRAINMYNTPGTTVGVDRLREWLTQNNDR